MPKLHVTIIDVKKFPDNEFLSILVSLLSLNGIWSVFDRVVSALITLPKQDREKLIFFVYSKDYPVTPDLLTF